MGLNAWRRWAYLASIFIRAGQLPLITRAAKLAHMIDLKYYRRRYGAEVGPSDAVEAAADYIAKGAARSHSPNALFDPSFYGEQLNAPLPSNVTPLEHYLATGADFGLDPSPLFSTCAYLREHTDVGAAGVNPLEHYLRWGVYEDRNILHVERSSMQKRIERVLENDPRNPFGLRMLGDLALKELEIGQAIEFYASARDAGHPTADDLLARTRQCYLAEIVDVRSHCQVSFDQYNEWLPQRSIDPPSLRFLGKAPVLLTSTPGELTAPPMYFAEVRKSLAFPRCNLVLQGDRMIYDLAAHALGKRAHLGDSFQGRMLVRARHGDRVLLESPDVEPRWYDAGLMMFGRQTANYGHWCAEFLPRMLVFDSDLSSDEDPLMIDDGMPPSHVEALALLNTRGRQIVRIPQDRPVHFERLGMVPTPIFFPTEMLEGVYDAVWPNDVVSALRARILSQLRLEDGDVHASDGDKIFISRRQFTSRQLVNEAAIADRLFKLGYSIVQPETLTFAEQVRTFFKASVVVGSCSSALSNALYCRPGARVVGLIHDHPSFNFRGYSSFIQAANASMIYVRGRSVPVSSNNPLHLSYEITDSLFDRALLWAESRELT